MAETATYTYFDTISATRGQLNYITDTREEAIKIREHLLGFGGRDAPTTEQVTVEIHVGDAIRASAFGRPRPGRVIAVNRKLITVDLIKNAKGEHHTRKVRPGAVARSLPAERVTRVDVTDTFGQS